MRALRRLSLLTLAATATVALVACGGSDDSGGEVTETSAGAGPETNGEVTSKVVQPDCAALEQAAAEMLGEGTTSEMTSEFECEFNRGNSLNIDSEGLYTLSVSAEPVRYRDLDFETAAGVDFDPEGKVEEEAPEGWTVAASRSTEAGSSQSVSSDERFLYFAGADVQGLVGCEIGVTWVPSDDPTAPAPTIDESAFLTFCNEAKRQIVQPT